MFTRLYSFFYPNQQTPMETQPLLVNSNTLDEVVIDMPSARESGEEVHSILTSDDESYHDALNERITIKNEDETESLLINQVLPTKEKHIDLSLSEAPKLVLK